MTKNTISERILVLQPDGIHARPSWILKGRLDREAPRAKVVIRNEQGEADARVSEQLFFRLNAQVNKEVTVEASSPGAEKALRMVREVLEARSTPSHAEAHRYAYGDIIWGYIWARHWRGIDDICARRGG